MDSVYCQHCCEPPKRRGLKCHESTTTFSVTLRPHAFKVTLPVMRCPQCHRVHAVARTHFRATLTAALFSLQYLPYYLKTAWDTHRLLGLSRFTRKDRLLAQVRDAACREEDEPALILLDSDGQYVDGTWHLTPHADPVTDREYGREGRYFGPGSMFDCQKLYCQGTLGRVHKS